MRENRTCSSEGGEPGDRASLPYHPSTEVSFRYDPVQPVVLQQANQGPAKLLWAGGSVGFS